jgi:p-aminobenzoyl-glutamate transporter AbgT
MCGAANLPLVVSQLLDSLDQISQFLVLTFVQVAYVVVFHHASLGDIVSQQLALDLLDELGQLGLEVAVASFQILCIGVIGLQ